MADLSEHAPLYLRIAAELREAITRGQYPPDTRCPSELELMQRWGVARETARNTLRQLRDEGLVEARHGFGTYVRAVPDTVELAGGDHALVAGPVTVTRGDGTVERFPAGVRLVAAPKPHGVGDQVRL